MKNSQWPELSYEEGKDTYQTLHLWTQIVGKIKLAKLPWINHSWHVTISVTPTGITTHDIPDLHKHFQINFDFLESLLEIRTSLGEVETFSLKGLSVAAFYRNIFTALSNLDIDVSINPIPNELADPIPFHLDETHATYSPSVASRFHIALLKTSDVLNQFRAEFVGKCSPVHFFWGGFDLAVSRFSGRKAPLHPGNVPHLPDWVAQEAYSQEVCSAGFWPGNDMLPYAAFYSYIYPEPEGYKTARIKPETAYYHKDLGEFILPYQAVQQASDPVQMLLEFFRSTYDAAADLAKWDRRNLEKQIRN